MLFQLRLNSILFISLGSNCVISTTGTRDLKEPVRTNGCRPRIVPWSLGLGLRAGSLLNISCQTDCLHLQARYDWKLELSTGEVLVISNSPELIINGVNFDNSGKLQCSIYINNLALISDPIIVSVVGPPYIDTEEQISNMTTSVGDDIDIEVMFCSRPPATVSWILSSGDSSGGQRMMLSGRNHGRFTSSTRWYDSAGHCFIASLHIKSLRIMDTGTFALQLDNSEGGIQRTFHITVATPIITETTSLWFFVLFFFACILLVLNRYTHSGFRSKPTTLV